MMTSPRIVLTCLAVVSGLCAAPVHSQESDTPFCAAEAVIGGPSYASKTIDFATRLAELGPRQAGHGEIRALAVVVEELKTIGMEVVVEEFSYETYLFESSNLNLGGAHAEWVVLGLNPFSGALHFSGEAVIVTDPSQATAEIKGRIVVTNHPLMQLMIAEFEPAVVICVEQTDLETFLAKDTRMARLEVTGRTEVFRSANVVARFGPATGPSQPEILVTSHLDAYQLSPGANDNGTGLGLMIELARAFATADIPTKTALTFVAFGAEEHGAIGSRAYIGDHVEDLDRIRAVVNLDTLGGALGPVIASKPSEAGASPDGPGVRVPEDLKGRAWEGPRGNWRIIHPEIIPVAFTSYYPEWLHEIVTRSADELGIEVVHLDLISDHRSFARAGVPAISIQSKEHQIHSETDTADALDSDIIEAGARLAVRILCELTR